MAIPAGMFYVRWVFTLTSQGVPTDVATFGLYFVSSSGTGTPPLDGLAEMARDAWNGNDVSTPSWYSTAASGMNVDAYSLDTAGHATGKGSAAFSGGDSWVGTGTTGLPWQDAVVVGTYGYNPSGFVADRARKRGRFYLPPMAEAVLDQDGTLDGSTQTGLLAGAAGFVADLGSTAVGAWNFVPHVLSKTGGASYEITYVRLGQVVDTQRRRRNKLPENFQQVAI